MQENMPSSKHNHADQNVNMKVEPWKQPLHTDDDSSRRARIQSAWAKPAPVVECQDILIANAAVLLNLEESDREAGRSTDVALRMLKMIPGRQSLGKLLG